MRCESIKKIILPKSIAKIGESAFFNCRSLESVIISSKIKVERRAFCECSPSMTFFTPNGEKTDIDLFDIKDNVLIGITKNVKEVVIPEVVAEIGFSAFLYHNLEKVTIPNSVKNIGNCAFEGCESLKSIDIPESVSKIGWKAFSCCESLTNIIIPKSVTEINTNTFEYCKSLTNVTIPKNLKFTEKTFKDCTFLKSLTTHEGEEIPLPN